MISYFPEPYKDEYMYNIVARYNRICCGSNCSTSLSELFGKESIPSIHFISKLEYLHNQFPNGCIFTPEYFIYNHTIMPFYKPFLPKERWGKIVEYLKKDDANKVALCAGISSGIDIWKPDELKVCIECMSEDSNLVQAYFHRNHQIPGNLVCHIHKRPLYQVVTDLGSSKRQFYNIDDVTKNCKKVTDDDYIFYLHNLSSDIFDLLAANLYYYDLETVLNRYYIMLDKKGLLTINGNVRHTRVCELFSRFYPEPLLEKLKCSVNGRYDNWIRISLFNKKKSTHPIKHLLFIRFLFGSIKEFLNFEQKELLSLGQGHFYCHNQVDDHYKKRIISDRFESKDKGVAEVNQDLSKKVISVKYQKDILDFIKREPLIGRKGIQKRMSKQYFWLYKHDRQVLDIILPIRKEFNALKNKESRIDWKNRDDEIYTQVVIAIGKLKESEKPIWITKNAIMRAACKNFVNALDKLPKTKKYIEENIESKENFQIRRVDYAVSKLLQEGQKINKDIITKKAGLLPYRPIKAYQYVDELLLKLKSGIN